MLIPVRCFSCNSVISQKWPKYKKMVDNNIPVDVIFKDLNIKRYCCKRMLLSHVDYIDDVIKHEQTYDYVDAY